ncbi:MAG: glucosidase [Chloroflexi bacterium]|nr:glucosidase [Chloroflexota bacterium]
MQQNAEHERLRAHRERHANWKNWGPYLSERAWGTVREDYSPNGTAWDYFPHDHARSRVYRWNEDGLAGICDRNQYLCFGVALWNTRDSMLKERLFGLTGEQGNHGEDVKVYYYYLDSTPTHSYMKMLYKYPQAAFPYEALVEENARRGPKDFEYELLDTGVFAENRYFDVFVEYAKADQNDILIRIEVINRGPETAPLHVLPTLWYRNTWSWGYPAGPMNDVPGKPQLRKASQAYDISVVEAIHPAAGMYYLNADGAPHLLFTENETNAERLFQFANLSPYVKDAFHRHVVDQEADAVNPENFGTKAAAHYQADLAPGERWTIRLRLTDTAQETPFQDFDDTFRVCLGEANAFYSSIQRPDLAPEQREIQRQAFAGMLWTKQLYYYDIEQWLQGDPGQPKPPRHNGRNATWDHLSNFDIISMPDKWEYPWYATWDLAFHCLPLVQLDPDFAKRQITLLTREWYMHPNGQLPAYEWAFDDVNPPVHAWAAWRVYQMDGDQTGRLDRAFLEGLYHKLLLNFTWWVNRKDAEGNNVFQGGFLGLDNISVFDRSAALPTGGRIDQSDGTAWMGFYCLEMMRIALELAGQDPVYQDTATKFFEHFLRIAYAMTNCGGQGFSLWNNEDGFFYDNLHLPDGRIVPLKVRSLVGLLPIIAVETIEEDMMQRNAIFARRMEWFVNNRPHLSGNMARTDVPGQGARRLIAILTRERLISVLRYMLDENEFLSDYGIRSVSKYHEQHPYTFSEDGMRFTVRYLPAESDNNLFGGNSNWRGPIWFPINYLIIEALRKFHRYYGESLTVEFPTGSGNMITLDAVADELSKRLVRLFTRDADGNRPIFGGQTLFQTDPHWRDYLLFHEYFHGDNGAGLGASHQTGWTGLIATLIAQSGGGQ